MKIKRWKRHFWWPQQYTVLSRGVRSLFRPTRKSSPWGNFSDGGLNQSIKRRLSLQTFINTSTWLVYWIHTARSVFMGAGQYSVSNADYLGACTFTCPLTSISLFNQSTLIWHLTNVSSLYIHSQIWWSSMPRKRPPPALKPARFTRLAWISVSALEVHNAYSKQLTLPCHCNCFFKKNYFF